MPRAGQTNPFSEPLVEKNRVWYGKNINFTRVVVTLALLGHQTSRAQNKFVLPSCIIYYYCVRFFCTMRISWDISMPQDKRILSIGVLKSNNRKWHHAFHILMNFMQLLSPAFPNTFWNIFRFLWRRRWRMVFRMFRMLLSLLFLFQFLSFLM